MPTMMSHGTVPTKHPSPSRLQWRRTLFTSPLAKKYIAVPTKHRSLNRPPWRRRLAARSLLMQPALAVEIAEQLATTRTLTAPPTRLAVKSIDRRS